MPLSPEQVREFQKIVWTHYRTCGRHGLPWRKTRDPYKILVSEVMLQQTQVERVKPFYTAFVRMFPTASRLARAPLARVLRSWQGLGYNRRAKQLHAAAKEIAAHGMPKDAAGLERLPGVGPYTARAVAAFAYGEDSVFIETNIRTAVLHDFFRNRATDDTIYGIKVDDAEIREVLKRVAPKGRAREWYWALMDYGAHLKRSGVRINAKSAHYAKQKAFPGSMREARGALVRELAKGERTRARLAGLLGERRQTQLEDALRALVREGLVRRQRARYGLAR